MSLVKSLDELEKSIYSPAPSPMDSEAVCVKLHEGAADHPAGNIIISLDGIWEMAESGNTDRIYGGWADSIPARIPGSVHNALLEAGKIPDPAVGLNDAVAREKSFKTWWFKRTFPRPEGTVNERLVFGGVCESCTIWVNGHLLGSHKGMFGGPEFDIGGLLQKTNTIIIKLDPAPNRTTRKDYELSPFFDAKNVGWLDTAVFSCVYGWHYANIPALGIWRSVWIEGTPSVKLLHPFVAAKDSQKGIIDLCTILVGNAQGWSGKLTGTIGPENFKGKVYNFAYDISSTAANKDVHLRFTVPDTKLWWPVDLGEQNLYHLKLYFIPEGGGISDFKQTVFGIRTIEMQPLPGGPYPDKYNWTFVVNGKPVFLKGSNWCTLDALMRFDVSRYDRFLVLARDQHVQFMRAWGGGMPETDEFYDLCNRKGIAILQEWPSAWDSQKVQPADILKETVERNIIRLRNNPALIMWGGGNESVNPTDAVMDMIGRLCYELDGTRPFHRTDPWGGSKHDYSVYWEMKPLDFNLSLKAPFIGEFGLACSPNIESVYRYMPKEEKNVWPPLTGGSFEHHTPVFNTMEDMKDMKFLSQYVPEFISNDSMQNFILGTQMAQATGIRHTLELARTRWPEATGVCYYKLTDVYPACSWATIDWYGVPKLGYYIFQDCYQPLHACAIFSKLNPVGEAFSLPVYLLDDANVLEGHGWKIIARAYNSQLDEIVREEFAGSGPINRVFNVGSLNLTEEMTKSVPMLIVTEVQVDGELMDRTFYWINYVPSQGSLFNLPKTELALTIEGNSLIVKNTGSKPAVAVNFDCTDISDTFMVEDNFFWLDAGETKSVKANRMDIAGIRAWNAG